MKIYNYQKNQPYFCCVDDQLRKTLNLIDRPWLFVSNEKAHLNTECNTKYKHRQMCLVNPKNALLKWEIFSSFSLVKLCKCKWPDKTDKKPDE